MEEALKKSELKMIVKECLLEILMEGVANNTQQSQTAQRGEIRENKIARKSPLEQIVPNRSPQKRYEDRKVVPETIKSIVPNDPVMSSIFADTASTTLKEQIAADSSRMTRANDTGVDPMSLFESAGNWASLAFSEPASNRGRA